jgi:Xaa-Pro aminopeptidase
MDHARRKGAFRARLGTAGLDAYWLADPPNVRYLSGFHGEDSGLLLTADASALVTDSRYAEQAEAEAQVDEVICRDGTMAEAAAGACRRLEVARLGVTSAKVSHAQFAALAREAGSVEVVACEQGIAEELRLCKDPDEVRALEAALRLAEASFLTLLAEVRPGRTESWLAARLEYEMRTGGAEAAAFETICAVDGRASVPHARPGQAAVGPQSAVLFDWGARLDGYCSDLTRVVCVDRIPARLTALVDVVLDAQAAALERLKPSVPCSEVDEAGRAVIESAGYGRFFGHMIGHGVGLEVHEGPRLGRKDETALAPGMVVTIEPGIYIPGELGVRIEQMARVTPDGCEVLTRLPGRPTDLLTAGG